MLAYPLFFRKVINFSYNDWKEWVDENVSMKAGEFKIENFKGQNLKGQNRVEYDNKRYKDNYEKLKSTTWKSFFDEELLKS
jgi:hypothetical protein